MSLLETQRGFLAEIAADDDAPPSSLGMAIYRNAYRARLSDALAVSFERTRRWVGEDMFDMAAAHYILAHPPSQWTLDAFGDRFPEALETLFAEDPEVAELAWLEWQMQQAFAAPDLPEAELPQFAAMSDGGNAASLRFAMAAGFCTKAVQHDIAALWSHLGATDIDTAIELTHGTWQLAVWRKAMRPHFRLIDANEWSMLERLGTGEILERAIQTIHEPASEPEVIGYWLASWINEGLFARIERAY